MRWMPHRSGVVSGFVVAGFGGGSFVFNQVQTRFVNPDNLNRTLAPYPDAPTERYYKAEDVERVPDMFLLLGATYSVMQLVAAMLMSNPPAEPASEEEVSKLLPATPPLASECTPFLRIWPVLVGHC